MGEELGQEGPEADVLPTKPVEPCRALLGREQEGLIQELAQPGEPLACRSQRHVAHEDPPLQVAVLGAGGSHQRPAPCERLRGADPEVPVSPTKFFLPNLPARAMSGFSEGLRVTGQGRQGAGPVTPPRSPP
jgi:hypothetical protein